MTGNEAHTTSFFQEEGVETEEVRLHTAAVALGLKGVSNPRVGIGGAHGTWCESRYDWPPVSAPRHEGDDPGGRAGFNARRSAGLKRADALAQLRLPASPAPAPPGLRPRAPAASDNDLWQPLGPATLLGGQAEGGPRVCGRVNAIALHPDGQRAYAAAANGGVLATTDGGASWRSVGGLAATNLAGIKRPAQTAIPAARSTSSGAAPPTAAIWCCWGPASRTPARPSHAEDGEYGLGVFVAIDPASSADDDPWKREAPELVNDAVYAFASNASGSEVYAATRTGLYQRPADASLLKVAAV